MAKRFAPRDFAEMIKALRDQEQNAMRNAEVRRKVANVLIQMLEQASDDANELERKS